ncbi:hypothetical protein BH20ACT17_BH20ACT17_12890 [soil metagenome]
MHEAIRFGDPIVTAKGGAAAEVPRLMAFISEPTGLTRRQILGRLGRRAPRTAAVLQALPLKAAGDNRNAIPGTSSLERFDAKTPQRAGAPAGQAGASAASTGSSSGGPSRGSSSGLSVVASRSDPAIRSSGALSLGRKPDFMPK